MRTVLVIDDEWVVADALEAVLADAGYRVVTAPNGRQGLARLAEMRPDVILLDFMMPVLNGAGVLDALASDPERRSIPVIMMSSLPEPKVAEHAKGYVAFLNKPFLANEVLEAVGAALQCRPGDTE